MKNNLRTAIASAVLLACSMPAWADITVQGQYLQLGINTGGSLIDFGTMTGLKFDPTGSGNFSSPIDFLSPGIPFAFYSIGVNGNWATAGGGSPSNPFGTATLNLSGAAGSPFVLTMNGSYSGLAFQQVISYGQASTAIHSTITFQNVSGTQLNNVVYAAGVDPDQDSHVYGQPWTQNTILGQGTNASVSATGLHTGYTLSMNNTTGWVATTASITGSWNTNPYGLAGPVVNDGNGDNTINLGYQLGNFAPGQEKTVGFDYAVAAVPEPETYGMMLAGLGMLGLVARRRARQAA